MTRTAEPLKFESHFKVFKNEIMNHIEKPMIKKSILWNSFKFHLPEGYVIDEKNLPFIKTLLRYFRGHEDFDSEFKLVRNNPDINKGIMVFGDNGVGKTLLMDVLHHVGQDLYKKYRWKNMRFDVISCGSFVEEYMRSAKQLDSNFQLKNYYKNPLLIDDLGFEHKAFNSFELIGDVLFERHRNKALTFLTTNKSPSEIGERYGKIIGDRIPEMFNIIKWTGESFRK